MYKGKPRKVVFAGEGSGVKGEFLKIILSLKYG